ncbi:MAG TPA: hypothetical protein VM889_04685 [Candidatus Thermoplasmatota archaeon]|nr:hypothetical protein [Candidatus Thermoplasmatota archaeon]
MLARTVTMAILIVSSAITLSAEVSADDPPPQFRIILFDVDNDVIVDCTEGEGLTMNQLNLCLAAAPGPILPPQAAASSGGPVGWREQTVYSDTITETCGYWRAQDGFQSCQIAWGGPRKVNSMWFVICYCSGDPQYATTGTIHNDLLGSSTWYYGTYKDSRNAGASDRRCRDFGTDGAKATGADGGIGEQTSPGNPCWVNSWDVKGSWGIGVNYKKESNDKGKTTTKVYVYR